MKSEYILNEFKTRFKRLGMLFILGILLTACTEQLTKEEQTYKDYCLQTRGAWMKMSELKEGMPTGKTCYGCMPDEKNHVCTQEEYKVLIK